MPAPGLPPRSLYLHVPFCARRCFYCDFAVHALRSPPTQEWLDAVARELELTAELQGWTAPLALDTVYVGGGTPSLLGEGALAALRRRLGPWAAWNDAAVEWTCEANPESFTPALAEDWRRAGVNRVSLGVQSFDAGVLRWMGRLHGPDGPARAVAAARAAGLANLSVDLIFALPARLGRAWRDDLERTLELQPEHVSLYGLTAEPGAPLGRRVREGREALPDEERYADEYLEANAVLTAAGFEHYEVSNFCRPGRESRHNLAYWIGAPYAALGPGAHAFFPPVRRWNMRSWNAYREAVFSGVPPLEAEERVSAEDAALERVWLGLRTRLGLPLEEATARQRQVADLWRRQGWATPEPEVLRLTTEGWLRLDRLAVEYAAAAAPAPPEGGHAAAHALQGTTA